MHTLLKYYNLEEFQKSNVVKLFRLDFPLIIEQFVYKGNIELVIEGEEFHIDNFFNGLVTVTVVCKDLNRKIVSKARFYNNRIEQSLSISSYDMDGKLLRYSIFGDYDLDVSEGILTISKGGVKKRIYKDLLEDTEKITNHSLSKLFHKDRYFSDQEVSINGYTLTFKRSREGCVYSLLLIRSDKSSSSFIIKRTKIIKSVDLAKNVELIHGYYFLFEGPNLTISEVINKRTSCQMEMIKILPL